MTRNQLKQLVKECLLEIIIEGSPNAVVESVKTRNSGKQNLNSNNQQTEHRRSHLDLIHPNGKTQESQQKNQVQRKNQNYKEIIGNNDHLAEIFADTASSGLVESIGTAHQSNPVVDTGFDPTLFEGSANWAKMAFADSKSQRA
jgi:hypothetical protein